MSEGKIREDFKFNIGTFDLFKGIAMLLVIMNHSIILEMEKNGAIINGLIVAMYAVGVGIMPAFFMVMGYSSSRYKKFDLILNKIDLLLKPFLIVMIITVFLNCLIHYCFFRYLPGAIDESIKVLMGFLFGLPKNKMILGKMCFFCGASWFFVASIWGQIIANFIMKVDKNFIRFLIVLLLSFIAWGLQKSEIYYWSIPQGIWAAIFMICGIYINQKKLLYKKWNIYNSFLVMLALFIFLLGVWYTKEFDSMAYGIWNLNIISLFSDIYIGFTVLYFSTVIDKNENFIYKFIKYLGRNSLAILCVHSIEMIVLPWYLFEQKLNFNKNIISFMVFFSRLMIILLFIPIMKWILNKTVYLKRKIHV